MAVALIALSIASFILMGVCMVLIMIIQECHHEIKTMNLMVDLLKEKVDVDPAIPGKVTE